jgi:SAM-dependent methyltransferase
MPRRPFAGASLMERPPEQRLSNLSTAVRLATITYTILALELTLIRWMSQQVRVFAYFTNLLIIAAFLGIGIGTALSRRAKRLIGLALPLTLALSAILSYGGAGLLYLSFPDRSIALWGAEGLRSDETFVRNVAIMLALLALVVAIFAALGARLGELFETLPPLRAYAIDLAGSLAGVAAATALAALRTSPPVWLLVALLPVAIWHSRTIVSWISLVGIVILAALTIRGAQFSPYNRIDLKQEATDPVAYVLSANRDHHQNIQDLSPGAVAKKPALAGMAEFYELPFRVATRRERALVVGAGTGNDVAAALRRGFRSVVAVEIDPVIRDIGKRLHPEGPYRDARVTPVVADARTYFEANGGTKFDVVCFGLLDSHAMFSSMSTLRLDNYVYTVEALRKAWALVGDQGVMTISFMIFHQPFVAERLSRDLHDATGQWPAVVRNANGSWAFITGKGVSGTEIMKRLGSNVAAEELRSSIRPATDDWPYLYLRPNVFPSGYVAVLTCVLLLAVVATGMAYRGKSARSFDTPLFFMGAAFLLVETRAVTSLSLLFGSTWIVNAAVFGGVLLIAFAANWVMQRMRVLSPVAVTLLFAALAVSYAVTNTLLAGLPLGTARLIGVLTNVLPIGFAGCLFSALLRQSKDPAASLGSNLLGAVAGGIIEYASMVIGLRALTALAAVLYVAAVVFGWRRLRLEGAGEIAGMGQMGPMGQMGSRDP